MSPALMRRSVTGAVALSVGVLGLSAPALASPDGTALVINEVYVNGGSSGASFTNKFVELYNPSASPISRAAIATATGKQL